MSWKLVLRLACAALLVGGVVASDAVPAGAHANLLGTEPGYGAELTSSPARALIRYDLPVETEGAEVTLERAGQGVPTGRLIHASPDRKDVAVPLGKLGAGSYVLTWFLSGTDGDVMGGELAFTVRTTPGRRAPAVQSPDTRPSAPPAEAPTSTPLARSQDAARLVASGSLAVLVGGIVFFMLLWPAGARVRGSRILLWSSLAGAVMANAAALGLKGAAVQGQSALTAFSPAALTALSGTHVARALTARMGFLLLALPVVAFLTRAPDRAVRSPWWYVCAGVSSLGALTTHGMLSHASARGWPASVAHIAHFGAVAVWLGGLVVLAVVVLPRRRKDELRRLVSWFSQLAFVSVTGAVLSGVLLLLLISPRWTALPRSEYGQLLLLKLALVIVILATAARARAFVRRCLPALASAGRAEVDISGSLPVAVPVPVGAGTAPGPPVALAAPPPRTQLEGGGGEADPMADPAALRPFVTAVMAEICIAAGVVAASALLLGRPPPA